jgi:hypothetical protein
MAKQKEFTIAQESNEKSEDIFKVPPNAKQRLDQLRSNLRKESGFLKLENGESVKILVDFESLIASQSNKTEYDSKEGNDKYFKYPVQIMNMTWEKPQIFELTYSQLMKLSSEVEKYEEGEDPIVIVKCVKEGDKKKYEFSNFKEVQKLMGK